MKWENLSKLIDICKQDLENYGHYMVTLNHGYDLRPEFNLPSNSKVFER